MDTSECTFGFDSNNTIVVVEGLVNPVQISESNRNIEEAVEQEVGLAMCIHDTCSPGLSSCVLE